MYPQSEKIVYREHSDALFFRRNRSERVFQRLQTNWSHNILNIRPCADLT